MKNRIVLTVSALVDDEGAAQLLQSLRDLAIEFERRGGVRVDAYETTGRRLARLHVVPAANS
ncbi:MAG: hypothetical protein WD557_05735 [Dehalococcoidia bacterium]